MNPLSDLERLVAAIEHQGANIAPTYQEYMPIAFATANDCGEAGRTFFHRICRLSEKYGCKVYLKREDLNHTGAHKINNAVGQMLLARRMGKRRIIAETGAGQHATVCALAGMECMVFMGKTDIERQHVNVEKMKMLGAQIVPVTSGNATLKDATNEAIRYWCCHPDDTYYLIGSTVGPHPYPQLVAHLQGNCPPAGRTRRPRTSRPPGGLRGWRQQCSRYPAALSERPTGTHRTGRSRRTGCRFWQNGSHPSTGTCGHPARCTHLRHSK